MAGTISTTAPTREETLATVQELRAELAEIRRACEHLQAEYDVADEARGSGREDEAAFEEWDAKLSRMEDAHVMWAFVALVDLVHQRLSGVEYDLLRRVKHAAGEMFERFLTPRGGAALMDAFALIEEDEVPSLGYIQGDNQ